MYIYQHAQWPKFKWDVESISQLSSKIRLKQGQLLGRMEGLGFSLKAEATLEILTQDVLKSSEIEGEILDSKQVRSSVARRLGMEKGALPQRDRNVEGVVEMMLDATQNFAKDLTRERLFGWHAALFPTARSGMKKITVASWRTDSEGPMQVISGPIGRPKLHFEAPSAEKLDTEMKKFLSWFDSEIRMDPVVRAGLAHLWFVTIHPFDDGNGRIARAITDMALARSEENSQRFYSMSAQIQQERSVYYEILERTQKGSLDISPWLEWFLNCLSRAFDGAEAILDQVLQKAKFWEKAGFVSLNDRQKLILNRLLDGFEGKMTSSKWAKLAKCSQDTAHRDIDYLIKQGLLIQNPEGGRSTSYSIVMQFEKKVS